MTSLHKTNKHSVFTIEGRPDIDLSLVFSRDFFNSIGFTKFRISHKYQTTQSETDKILEDSDVIVQDLEKDEHKLAERLLGPEIIPNGYTQLPLKRNDTIRSNNTKQTGGGILDTISDYITPYFYSKRVVDETIEGETLDAMKIEFTTSQVQSFDEWKNTHLSTEPSLYSFQNTTITYEMLEQIIDNLYAQFCDLHDNGFTIQNVSTDFVYMIEDKLVLLDGNAVQNMDIQHVQDKSGCKAILQVIFDLLGKKSNDVHVNFSEIQHTGVYNTLMRLQNDGVFII